MNKETRKFKIMQGLPKKQSWFKTRMIREQFLQTLETNQLGLQVPCNAYYSFEEIQVYFDAMVVNQASGELAKGILFDNLGFNTPDPETVVNRCGKQTNKEREDHVNKILLEEAKHIPTLKEPLKLEKLRRHKERIAKDKAKSKETSARKKQKRKKIRETRVKQRERGVKPPKGVYLTCDITLKPYYGELDVELPNGENLQSHIIKHRQKKSTKYFFGYCTVYSHEAGSRQVLAIHQMRRYQISNGNWHREALGPVVKYLLDPILDEFSITGIAGDGEYYNKGVIEYLHAKNLDFVIRADFTDNIRKICEREELMEKLADGKGWELEGGIVFCKTIPLRLVVVKRGKELVPLTLPKTSNLTPEQALFLFEERFGIETSYREIYRYLGSTSSHSPQYRLAIFCMAAFFFNLLLRYYEVVVAWSNNPKKWHINLIQIKDKIKRILYKILLEVALQ